jgi:hypothetical protein
MMPARPFLFLLFLSAGAHSALAQPIPPENIHKYDLGKLEAIEDLELAVPFKNSTNAAVQIFSVRGTCACMDADFEPKLLEPGDMGYLSIAVNLSAKRGHFTEKVEIFTNVPDKTQLIFEFSGYVNSDVEVRPKDIFFYVSDSKKIAPVSVTFESTRSPLKGIHAIAPPEWLAFESELLAIEPEKKAEARKRSIFDLSTIETEKARKLIQCKFSVEKDKLPLFKSGAETIFFGTEPSYPDPVFLVANWQRDTMYAASPKQLEIPGPAHEYRKYLHVSLKRIDGQPFNIENAAIKSGVGGLEISNVAKKSSHEWEIEIQNNVEAVHLAPPGTQIGTIAVKTDAEDDPAVELPVIVGK